MTDERNNEAGAGKPLPTELREALDGLGASPANPEFRARLREQFLAAGQESGSANEVQVLEGLSGWEQPVARPAFRQDLRERFLAAGADQSAKVVAPAPRRVARRRARPKAPVRPATGRLLSFRQAAVGLSAAAALLIAIFIFVPERDPVVTVTPVSLGWQAVDVVDGASYSLDGADVARLDATQLERVFSRGDCSLSTGPANLILLHMGDGILLEITPGSEVEFPTRAGADPGLLEIEVRSGGLHVATTEAFQGRVVVTTPDTTIELSGTALGVDVLASGTCLCILGGEATLIPRGARDQEPLLAVFKSTTFIDRADGLVVKQDRDAVYHKEEMAAFAALGDKHLF